MASQIAMWLARWEKGWWTSFRSTDFHTIMVKMDGIVMGVIGSCGMSTRSFRLRNLPNHHFKRRLNSRQDYKAIKSTVNRSGISWSPITFIINTTDEKWDEIIEVRFRPL